MTPHRSGSLLVIVAGMLGVLLALTLTFFLRMRQEARSNDVLIHQVRARSMLYAAMSYIQEASRVGYAEESPGGNPHQYHYSSVHISSYWNSGSYSSSVINPAAAQEEQTWVGWYSPVHRGLFRPQWGYFQDCDPVATDLKYAQWPGADFSTPSSPLNWKPRLLSLPYRESPASTPFWQLPLASRPRPRAEITDLWPLPAPGVARRPKLFPMYVMKEPPYAVIPHQAHVGQFYAKNDPAMAANGIFATVQGLAPSTMTPWDVQNKPFNYPRTGAPPAIAGYDDPDPASKGYYPDPHPLRTPNAAVNSPWRTGDPAPRGNTVGMGWFRIYRETHDTFLVTVGSGASAGWNTLGENVVSEMPCPFASQQELDQAIAEEVRMWYRIRWSPTTGVSRNYFLCASSNMIGSISMVQRIPESTVNSLTW